MFMVLFVPSLSLPPFIAIAHSLLGGCAFGAKRRPKLQKAAGPQAQSNAAAA